VPLIPRALSPARLPAAAENAYLKLFRGGVADLTPWPSAVVEAAPHCTVSRYRMPGDEGPAQRTPVLLVPPLAAPPGCFDLYRDCSLAEHLTALGYLTYFVDYGRIGFDDRALGLEHWINSVIPRACGVVLNDSGADRVQLISWSLGGIMSLLGVADGRIEAASVSMVGSPFDFAQVRMMAPVRRLAELTGGAVGTALYRALGGAPSPLVRLGFQATAIQRELTKPLFLARNLDNREVLAHAEAVDHYMRGMIAYPGRSFGQLYHRFFRINEIRGGRFELSNRTVDLRNVRAPVLAVAGTSDVLAPRAAVAHVARLVPHAAEIRLEDAPGGHLGVLTGRAAERTTWRYIDEFLLAAD
jgi:poly[(R)-3-hydroxyalkanoate] polymerase subunit PhaC